MFLAIDNVRYNTDKILCIYEFENKICLKLDNGEIVTLLDTINNPERRNFLLKLDRLLGTKSVPPVI